MHNRSISHDLSAPPAERAPVDTRHRGDARRHIAIGLGAAVVYFGGRLIIEGAPAESARNAQRILDVEGLFRIDIERGAQNLVLESDLLRAVGNLSYVWLHWPLLIAVLIVLFHRSPIRYIQLRNSLIASGLVGLALFWVFPASPPRFMPGYEGTVSDAARRHYLDLPLSWTNQYASFPSFHIGWTLLACLALAATFESGRKQTVAMIPAALVALAVVTTANHYVLDTVAGATIAFVAYAFFGSRHDLATIGLKSHG